ncbi:MAG: thrombospondin type 3 repeat-containing protein [Chloroflexi bacterium]|nr:thrombospondin type 3 repeat-containing protein [Chloroflexota bacterium]
MSSSQNRNSEASGFVCPMPLVLPLLRSRIAATVALAAILLTFGAGNNSIAAVSFDPASVICFETLETPEACDGDTSPDAVTDLRQQICVGWNEDCTVKDSPVFQSDFGEIVRFTPAAFGTPTVPPGAIAGRMTQEITMGLLSNPCSTTIQTSVTLMTASTDVHDTIAPKPFGEADVMEPFALDADGNGLPDGIDRYPEFLNERFNDLQPVLRLFGTTFLQGSWAVVNLVFFEPGVTLPIANRSVPLDPTLGVPGVVVMNDPTTPPQSGPISDFCSPSIIDFTTLGYTLDNPCTPVAVEGVACPGTQSIFENRGYPLFPCEVGNRHDEDGDGIVNDGCPQVGSTAESGEECDNDISDDFEDSNVNDGCPQVGDHSEGQRIPGTCVGADEGGCIFSKNPSDPGPATFVVLATSLRDADNDGIENELDVCPLIANPNWNPRTISLDPDFDGLPTTCDPTPLESFDSLLICPSGIVGPDEDQDCYSNRADNCPLVNQLKDPSKPPSPDNGPAPLDTDLDGIGDACDPNPNDPDTEGKLSTVCLFLELEVGGDGSPAIGVPVSSDCPPVSPSAKGNIDCDNDIDATDAQLILFHVAELTPGQPIPASASQDCPGIGDQIPTAESGDALVPPDLVGTRHGDMDCDHDIDAVDALFILRFVANLPAGLPPGCAPIGLNP